MTNYEKIKNMSVEEMAEFLSVSCKFCDRYYTDYCKETAEDCIDGTREWLESEADE